MSKVSVSIITYNHEKFIEKTLESVLCQIIDIDIEIVICDDCSTDNTPLIINNYLIKYPNIIKFIKNSQNIGPTKTFFKAIEFCSGDFIALLDGDDYWTDENKLATQILFLRENESYITCFHQAKVVDEKSNSYFYSPSENIGPDFNLIDLIAKDSFMTTSSIMFKRIKDFKYPNVVYTSWGIGDWPLNVINSTFGPIKYINKCMSVYRQSSSNTAFTANSNSYIYNEAIKINIAFDKYFNLQYNKIISNKLIIYKTNIFYSHLYKLEFKKALSCFLSKNSYDYNVSIKKINIILNGFYYVLRGSFQKIGFRRYHIARLKNFFNI